MVKQKQMFYTTFDGGLVKVKNPSRVKPARRYHLPQWQVEVVADHYYRGVGGTRELAYRQGEKITTSRLHLVDAPEHIQTDIVTYLPEEEEND
jgi:hypothetical protein